MPRFLIGRCALALFVYLILATPILAQPSLSKLWPIDADSVWEFDVRVEGPFEEVRSGVLQLIAAGQVGPPLSGTAWCFDSVWKEPLGAPGYAAVPGVPAPLLLNVPPCGVGVGVLADDASALGVWNSRTQDWEWWWMEAEPAEGSSFRLPIRTQIVGDAFVEGEVRTVEGVIAVPAGSFEKAVFVDYRVELGESEIRNEHGEPLGTAVFGAVGWVAFVPGVGPVASEESFGPAAIECPECPPEAFETIVTSMQLVGSTEVKAEPRSWASVKAEF